MSATLPANANSSAPKRARGRPRKTLDERDEGNRRRQLMKAAAKLFRRKGFDATSTRDIASAVGMHSGSPFYHFKSKSELLYALMEEGMQSALDRQGQVLVADDAPARQLKRLIRSHFDTLHGPGRDVIPVMLYESRSLTPRQRAGIAKLQRDYEAAWMPSLQALHANGQLRADAHLARLLIFGALNWSVQWFDARKQASLDEITDAAMALFIREDH
jgi:AcrR family transcriptional regulator